MALAGGLPPAPSVLVIDGYNLIKRVDALSARLDGPKGLEAARSYLMGWLRRNHAARQRRTILVLDGPRPGRSDFGPIEVYYAPSADEAVRRFSGPGALVITSDLDLAGSVRALGAEVLSSEDFWAALTARERRPITPARDGQGRDAPGSARDGSRRTGNPRRKSKAEKRRERERTNLMRKV